MDKFFLKIPFIDQILKGAGQIMLQENRWTGLLFIFGLFIGSWQCGAAVVLAAVCGTLIARILKYSNEEIKAGLYGFSPALVGAALVVFFENTLLIWVLIIAGASLAAIVQHFFIIRKIPAYTFPFILVTWVLFFLIKHFTETGPSNLNNLDFIPLKYDSLLTGTNGFGEVIFQGNRLSGILFFTGVFVSNPVSAVFGLAGSLLGSVLSLINGQSFEQIQMGLFGFNAVLTAIAFSGNKKNDGFWVITGCVITIIINNILSSSHILDSFGGVLTFPFVAGTWITLFVRRYFNKQKNELH